TGGREDVFRRPARDPLKVLGQEISAGRTLRGLEVVTQLPRLEAVWVGQGLLCDGRGLVGGALERDPSAVRFDQDDPGMRVDDGRTAEVLVGGLTAPDIPRLE